MALRTFAPPLGRRAPRILLIDNDDVGLLKTYRELVETEGYAVYTCPRPFAQPADIARLHPDVVVLDLVHSGRLEGWRMLAALRAFGRTRAIPVMVCTLAIHAAEARIHAHRDLALRVLVKPCEYEDFLGTLVSALELGVHSS